MEKISVSIIVPVYQAESYLQKSVETITQQTLQNIEILLVNDGSTDNSPALCDELSRRDKRIRVIHQKNSGQSSARNTGIEAAQGEYIGFMDNDDFLYPKMCETLYKNAKNNDADISACSYITKDESGKTSHDKHNGKIYKYDNRQGVKELLTREILDIYVWTKIYRKEFLNKENIRFEEGRSEEDWLFNRLAYFAAKKSVMEDTPVYLYIERQNSTCRTFYKKNLKKYLDDVCYRMQLIENEVANKYPDLQFWAKRQTIKTCFRVLFVISKHSRRECEPYYSWIKKYLYTNSQIVIKERYYWEMSLVGVVLASYMPTGVYFYLKKWKNRKIN
ncbi:glycosyltransferase [Bacteroides stercorirosoris]|jgi:glycosyltransferase involved in cell wall biosynthesis|uniref:Glycosyltransferase involved in cell wall bisynthesis n=1 Tax=Bacteroides stercorirosoris TaxID=871324 RepID=A0A1M6GC71_9BACE|nr:glycosyltransferase [Bacteroides stercorirosoris]OKZ09784.1 MAG: hypothetical protein BHV75_11525 [Bacteroides oleiciplenus]SHJ07514.1 Glycosyltransferase involved in cell wall bisynthesis [Bacteroides stercorirosoris]